MLTIGATFGLFVLALFVKGIGKDLLLEAGVLMVSIKLIMMSSKNALQANAIREDLDRIIALMEAQSKLSGPKGVDE